MIAELENQTSYPTTFLFLVNPSAGKGRYDHIVQIIHHILSNYSVKYDIVILKQKGEAISLAKEGSENYDAIVAVGGDGTINEVFNGLIGTKAIFGIIPAGTGNGFARSMGVPLRIEDACKLLMDGSIKVIDVGATNEKYFLGTAGMGFDAAIAAFAGKNLGHLRGMWLYFYAGVLTYFQFSPKLVNLRIDSQCFQIKPLIVAIANTKIYGGSALIAPDAESDDGLLDVCVIEEMGAFELAWHLPKLFKGTHIYLPKVSIHKCKSITINTEEPVPIHLDGEVIGSYSEIQFNVIPKAIRVIVPKIL